jgi:outer membrane receptor protein involved in Fe transport
MRHCLSMRHIPSIVFLAFLFGGLATAQITGDIKGTVLDATGAAVPNTKVTLTSAETGEQRTVTADGEGRFAFNLLKIGEYELRAEANGFRAAGTRAEVRSGEIAAVQFHLEVGSVTETLQVTDAVTPIDTQNAQLQTSVTGGRIQELPVNRNADLLALTAPGVAPVSTNNPFLGSGSFNSNGGRGRGNNITVDGITATDVSVTGTGGPLAPLNFSSIKEVKVITNNFSAEYGRNSSAQVLYMTKNGTNELHGELYEYFRNNVLEARSFFDRSGKAAIVRRNIFGFSAGGPAYIPRVFDGRNRTFWHVDYEGVKQRGAGAARIARVPNPAQLAAVTDPTSRALVQQYQVPSDPSGTLQTSAREARDTTQLGVRVDQNIGANDVLWARFSRYVSTIASSGNTFIASNLPGFGAISVNRPLQATLAETHLFSSAMVNEFRFGFGRSQPDFPMDTPYPLGPRVQFSTSEVDRFGQWEGLPQGRSQFTYQFTDNLSLVRGAHSLKTGLEYYHLQADSYFDALQRPLITFSNWTDFAAGRPNAFQQRFGDSVRANRVKNVFAFFQDDWKATRNLTINLGLRLEYAGGPTEKNGIISNLNLDNRTSHGIAGSGPFGLLETGKPSFESNYNWGPRLGFAWTPGGNQRTVVRGGYGVAYDFVFLNPITNQRFLPPFIVTGSLSGTSSFEGDNALARIVAGTAAIQRDTRAQVGQLATNTRNFGNISPAIAFDLSNAQVQQWNFGVQREIKNGLVAKASYVGTKGNFLPRTRSINLIGDKPAPAASVEDESRRLAEFTAANVNSSGGLTRPSNRLDPRYNEINYVESSANSIYHGMQLELQQRFSTLFLNANYTFAKSIDDNSDVLGVLINDNSLQQNPLNNKDNRGASQFDLKHRFVASWQWSPAWGKSSSMWAVRSLLAGWAISGITNVRSGFPVLLDAGARHGIRALTLTGIVNGPVRPNITGAFEFTPMPNGAAGSYGTRRAASDPQPISTYAASLGLSQPLLGNFGTLGRNVNRLNGEVNQDLILFKNFALTESKFFQVRAELYNAFNNTSFQEVDANITSPTFGNYLTTTGPGRWIQLGLRLVF